MNKLKRASFGMRTLSGVVFFIVMVGAVLLSYYTFIVLMMIITIGSMNEFYKMAKLKGAEPQRLYGIVIGLEVLLGAAIVSVAIMNFGIEGVGAALMGVILLGVALFMTLTTFFVELYRKRENPMINISVTIGGLMYVAIPLSMMLFLANIYGYSVGGSIIPSTITANYNPWVILGYLFMVWGNDVGAYLFGVTLGRHKLFERISPNKSWEGFFGGLLVAVLIGAAMGWWLEPTTYNTAIWAGAGVVVTVTGVLGDLVESMFKRSAGVKDSGTMMPGHGGFLDRFDALLLSAPFVLLYFTILEAIF